MLDHLHNPYPSNRGPGGSGGRRGLGAVLGIRNLARLGASAWRLPHILSGPQRLLTIKSQPQHPLSSNESPYVRRHGLSDHRFLFKLTAMGLKSRSVPDAQSLSSQIPLIVNPMAPSALATVDPRTSTARLFVSAERISRHSSSMGIQNQ